MKILKSLAALLSEEKSPRRTKLPELTMIL